MTVLDCGTFRPKGEDFFGRCRDISFNFKSRIQQPGSTPFEYVLIERVGIYRKANPTDILKLGMAVGIIIGVVTTSEGKTVFVRGHKTKAEARQYSGLYIEGKISEHCADAISMAHYWVGKNWTRWL